MKKIFFKLALSGISILLAAGCSSGGGGGNTTQPVNPPTPPVSEFSQALAGKWISDCIAGLEGNYKETLELSSTHSGTRFRTFYRNASCSGFDSGTTPVQSFTYQEGVMVNNLTPVTLAVAGEASTTLQISIFNRTMDVISANGLHARYTRINQVIISDPNRFDSLAIGVWQSQTCEAGAQVHTSSQEILTIHGAGQADSSYMTYPSSNCSGKGRVMNQQNFTYSIDRFLNRTGQLKVNDQLVEVSFEENLMIMTSAQNSAMYVRIQ